MLSSQIPTVVAVGGGLAAQATDPIVAWTGLVVAIGGLVAGLIRALPGFYEWRLAMRKYDLQITQLQTGMSNAHARLAQVEKSVEQAGNPTAPTEVAC